MESKERTHQESSPRGLPPSVSSKEVAQENESILPKRWFHWFKGAIQRLTAALPSRKRFFMAMLKAILTTYLIIYLTVGLAAAVAYLCANYVADSTPSVPALGMPSIVPSPLSFY